jgi:hypothetical protein
MLNGTLGRYFRPQFFFFILTYIAYSPDVFPKALSNTASDLTSYSKSKMTLNLRCILLVDSRLKTRKNVFEIRTLWSLISIDWRPVKSENIFSFLQYERQQHALLLKEVIMTSRMWQMILLGRSYRSAKSSTLWRGPYLSPTAGFTPRSGPRFEIMFVSNLNCSANWKSYITGILTSGHTAGNDRGGSSANNFR